LHVVRRKLSVSVARASHLDPRYHPVKLVRRKFIELNDVRGEFFDKCKDLPDDISGNDVLDPVEYGLFPYVRLAQYVLDIHDFHVSDLYLERSEPRRKVGFKNAGHAERVAPFDDRNNDVVFIDDVVLEHGMDDVRRDLLRVFREKEGRAVDLVHALVYLVIADEKNIKRQRPEGTVQSPLPIRVEKVHAERDRRDDERPVAAVGYLVRVRQEKGHRDHRYKQGDGRPDEVLPEIIDPGHHDTGEGHGPGDRQAVRGREVAGFTKFEDDEQHREHKRPVDEADVYLRLPLRGRVLDPEDRHDPRGDPLEDYREHSADHRLRGDDRRGNGKDQERDIEEPRLVEYHFEQHVPGLGVPDQERALAEVVEEQRKKDEVPRLDDRFTTQVAHIGVERFTARCAEDNLREDEKPRYPAGYLVREKKMKRIIGIHSLDDVRNVHDRGNARNNERREPHEHDGSERAGYFLGPLFLIREKGDRDHSRDHDQGILRCPFKSGDEEHAFHGAQDTDSRGDNAVADDEGNTDVGQEGNECELSAGLEKRSEKLPQHDGASLSVPSKAHGKPGILNAHEKNEGPDNEREDADHVLWGLRGQEKDDGDSIDGACADVAEHKAEGFYGTFEF